MVPSPLRLSVSPEAVFGREEDLRLLQRLLLIDDASPTNLTSEEKKVPQSLSDRRRSRKSILLEGPCGVGKTTLLHHLLVVESHRSVLPAFANVIRTSGHHDFVFDLVDRICNALNVENDASILADQIVQRVGGPDMELLASLFQSIQRTFGIDCSKSSDGESVVSKAGCQGADSYRRVCLSFLQAVSAVMDFFVVCIEDIHNSGEEDLRTLESFIDCEDLARNMTFICTIRTEEPTSSSSSGDGGSSSGLLQKLLKRLEEKHALHRMKVENLNVAGVNELLSSCLNCNPESSRELAVALHSKSSGNPLVLRRYVELIQNNQYLWFSVTTQTWKWDIHAISTMPVADNVLGMLSERMQSLERPKRILLALASIMGNTFESKTLATAASRLKYRYDDEDLNVDSVLKSLVQSNILNKGKSKRWYNFTHEELRRQVLSWAMASIPIKDHEAIAALLLRNSNSRDKRHDWPFFSAVDILNRVAMLRVNDDDGVKSSGDFVELAEHNLKAAMRARRRAAFTPSARYAATGLKFLSRDDQEHAGLYMELSVLECEMLLSSGNLQRCRTKAKLILDMTENVSHTSRASVALITSLGLAGDIDQSISEGVVMLRHFGLDLPRIPNPLHVLGSLISTRRLLKKKSNEDLLSLPRMRDERKLAATKLSGTLAQYVAFSGTQQQNLAPLLFFSIIKMTLSDGMATYSPSAFAIYGATLLSMGNREASVRYSLLARKMHDCFRPSDRSAMVILVTDGLINPRFKSIQHSLDPLMDAYKNGIIRGDPYTALTAAGTYSYAYFMSGLKLQPLKGDLEKFVGLMTERQQRTNQLIYGSLLQLLYNLTNATNLWTDPTELDGKFCDEESVNEAAKLFGNNLCARSYYSLKYFVAYLFGDLDEAMENLKKFERCGKDTIRSFIHSREVFFAGMICVGLARRETTRRRKQRKYLGKASRYLRTLKQYVRERDVNALDHLLLLNAERMSVKDPSRSEEVLEAFDKAIVASTRCGLLHNSALGKERAGVYAMNQMKCHSADDNPTKAINYLTESMILYDEWGALSKVKEMELNYAAMELPCSQQTQMSDTTSCSGAGRVVGRGTVRSRMRFDHKLAKLHKNIRFPQVSAISELSLEELLEASGDGLAASFGQL